jgi:hypothetical protein
VTTATLTTLRARIDARLAREAKLTAAWAAPVVTTVTALTISVARFGLGGNTVWSLWLTIATLVLASAAAWSMRNRIVVSLRGISVWAGSAATAVAALVLALTLPGS